MKRLNLASRTALAAALAAVLALVLVGAVLRGYVYRVLVDRVDKQLESRVESAPILAAVGERLSVSELGQVTEGARVVFLERGIGEGSTFTDELVMGVLPTDSLPAVSDVGFSTARADGEQWRLLTVRVDDVPVAGDRALVQLVAPLGDVDAQTQVLRRQFLVFGSFVVAGAGVVGYLLGLLALGPLLKLRRDASSVGVGPATDWRVEDAYGVREADDLAHALNIGLDRIAVETRRSEEALEAARAFSAAAAHELRTPLTGAVTNLDVARSGSATTQQRDDAVGIARSQMLRMSETLTALRDLADADLAGTAWFERFDLADLVGVIVDEETRRHPGIEFGYLAPQQLLLSGWRDGLRLACANLLRNAVTHGVPKDGAAQCIVVEVAETHDAVEIQVRDNGPGIMASDRERVLQRFVRGDSSGDGTGLGLALVGQVAHVHGGGVEIREPSNGVGACVCLVLSKSI